MVEAQQLEYGRQACVNVTLARSGSFLQEPAMQVGHAPLLVMPLESNSKHRLSIVRQEADVSISIWGITVRQ